MAEIALILGTAATAAGQIQQGRVAEAQGRASRDISEFNAANLEREAESRKEAAAFEAQRIGRRGERARSKLEARAGKSGLTLAGSKLDVLADTAFEYAVDSALTLRAGLFQAQTLKARAAGQRYQGKWQYLAGKHAKRVSRFQAGASILAGAVAAYGALPAGGGGGVSTGTGTSALSGGGTVHPDTFGASSLRP